MIDLHTHSHESDGSWSPARLVEEALGLGLDALAITDHDTLSGYDGAAGQARTAGLDLVCAISLSTKLPSKDKPQGKNVHVLAYFLDGPPAAEFRNWLVGNLASRRDRNQRLALKLQSIGLDGKLEEAEALGRTLTGRPHFARVLVQKGYVTSIPQAFDQFLDESARAYVPRREPSFADAVGRISAAGGLPVLAHPFRLAKSGPDRFDILIREMIEQGLRGIEAYHSDHTPAVVRRFLGLASAYGLAVTGGSDFHGETKPGVALGKGRDGNLAVPREVLDRLRDSNSR